MTQLLSDAALELLAHFESLPEREQHELLVTLLRRTDECPDSVLAGDELAGLADELFRTLDTREATDSDSDSQ